MKALGWMVCRSWIEKKVSHKKEILFSYLSPLLKQKILHMPSPLGDLTLGFDLVQDLISWVHPSWLSPFLRTFSEHDIRFFLASLEAQTNTYQKLKEQLQITGPLPSLSAHARQFFQEKMARALIHPMTDLPPLNALAPRVLPALLTLSMEELRLLPEFLGLHDLAIEMRQIIDNVKIKQIYAFLSHPKQHFLKILLHKRESVVFRPLEISRWDGDRNALLSILFQRGMNRLSKALYSEDPFFVWYIKHRMDAEESQLFTSFYKSLSHPKGHSLLARQVLEVLQFFKTLHLGPSP